jgi:hypothetical protein
MRFGLVCVVLGAIGACSNHHGTTADSTPTISPVAPSCIAPSGASTAWMASDGFCRDLATAGITLVDWDGEIANPTIAITVTPPQQLHYPVALTVSTDEPRIFFDRGSRDLKARDPYLPPTDTHTFDDASPVLFRIAIWPDRDGNDEEHVLHLVGGGVATDVPIHVVDQDLGTSITYPITVDFSQDQPFPDGTRFFDDSAKRAIVVQAANDWAYFFDGTGLDPVLPGQESTSIDGMNGWYGPRSAVANASAFTGFLLYAVGVHTTEVRSTGFPASSSTYETSSGQVLPGNLYRSGALEVERDGNYDASGWYTSPSDENWYLYDNEAGPTDLASIVHHEMGHALFFCGDPACPGPGYARFTSGSGSDADLEDPAYDGTSWGSLTSPEIAAYYPGDLHGGAPAVLPTDFRNHLAKVQNAGAIDPASGLGAFGNEYADDGVMPLRRWIITKLDLLAAQAIGYPLRTTMSPFVPPSITNPVSPAGDITLAAGAKGTAYSGSLTVAGGVPAYNWTVADGVLPPGPTLDSFQGTIEGTPTTSGTYAFEAEVEDSLGAMATQQVEITIP